MYRIFQDDDGTWWVMRDDYYVPTQSLVSAMALVDVMKDRQRSALVN